MIFDCKSQEFDEKESISAQEWSPVTTAEEISHIAHRRSFLRAPILRCSYTTDCYSDSCRAHTEKPETLTSEGPNPGIPTGP